MTDVDESLLTAAKLREQIRGRLDGDTAALDHTAVISDPQDRKTMSFLEQIDGYQDTSLKETLLKSFGTDTASEAVHNGNASILSNFVGVTEQDLNASELTLPVRLIELMENNEAPCFATAIGNPNTGKTNTMLLLAELYSVYDPDCLVITNFNSGITDLRVSSAHELAITLLEHRDTPKFVIVDEASTHFDSRTNRRPVAVQWTPLAKRFAKLDVVVCGLIAHTGKDLHPEAKRLATLPFFKRSKKEAEFFDRWPADSDAPEDPLFSGALEDLEKAGVDYDADTAAPWAWNLQENLFAEDLSWSELLEVLRIEGPAES